MNEKIFEKTREQATRWMETATRVTMDHLCFAREEAERQLRNGVGLVEFAQQSVLRQWEQVMQAGKTFVELQEGVWKETLKAFATRPEA